MHPGLGARGRAAIAQPGIVAAARAGKLRDFTGVNAPSEVPQAPELHLDRSGDVTAEALAERVIAVLRARGLA